MKKICKSIVSFCMIAIYLVNIIMPLKVSAAISPVNTFKFNNMSLDNKLVLSDRKVGTTDEITVEFDITNTASSADDKYILEFYAPNGEDIIKHQISILKEDSGKMTYYHDVFKYNKITSNYDDFNAEYLKRLQNWDFTALPFPTFVLAENAGRVEQELIYEDITMKGNIYQMHDQEFRYLWAKDLETKTDKLYLTLKNINGIKDGYIYDFKLTKGSQDKTISKINTLKIENLPTRWFVDSTAELINPTKMSSEKLQSSIDENLIGMNFKINVPMKFSNNSFVPLDNTKSEADGGCADIPVTLNLAESAFGLSLDPIVTTLSEFAALNEEGVDKLELEVINIPKCNSCSGTCVHNQIKSFTNVTTGEANRKYIGRDNIKTSMAYNMQWISNVKGEVITVNKLAFTYLNYDIIRKNVEETYIIMDRYETIGKYTLYGINAKNGVTSENIKKTDYSWASHIVSEIESKDSKDGYVPEKIFIPVAINRDDTVTMDNNYTFLIEFTPYAETRIVDSELEVYNSNMDKDIALDVARLGTPRDIVVLIDEDTNQVEVSKFLLNFKVPTGIFAKDDNYKIIKYGEKAWYEVNLNVSSRNEPGREYQTVAVIYLKRIESGIHKDKLVVSTDIGIYDSSFDVYDENEPIEFTIADKYSPELTAEIELKLPWTSGSGSNEVEERREGWKPYIVPAWADLDLRAPATNSTEIGVYKPKTNFSDYISGEENPFFNLDNKDDQGNVFNKVPGNYFITLRGFYDSNPTDGRLSMSDYSIPINVVLEKTKEIVELPKKLDVVDVSDNSFELELEKAENDEYSKIMLEPIDSNIKKSGIEMFLSSSQEELERLMLTEGIADKKDIVLSKNVRYIENDELQTLITTDPVSHEVTITFTDDIVEDIRNSKTIIFESDIDKYTLANLDKNQTYYVLARTKLGIDTRDSDDDINYNDYSVVTDMKMLRTTSDIIVPDPEEKLPPTPLNFSKDSMPTDKQICVRWEEPELIPEDYIVYGYEILRVGNEKLQDEDRGNNKTVEEIISSDNYDITKGFRVIENELYLYDKASGEYNKADANTEDKYENVIDKKYMKITDTEVYPNTIYYYYIRTIKLENKTGVYEDQNNSEWSELTATTTPITGVINIKQEISGYTYDDYYETVISFEAPILDENTVGEGKDYDFKIVVKDPASNIYLDTYPVLLIDTKPGFNSSYKRYVYKISNLKSGKKYSIKAAIVDRIALDENGNPSLSKYSSILDIRTNFSQKDYDEEARYDEYEEYYNIELKKLIDVSKFVLEDSRNKYSVKFKEERTAGDIGALKNRYLTLDTMDNVDNYEYFISAKNLKDLKNSNVAIRIMKDDLKAIIPVDFLDDENEALKEMNTILDSLYEDADDYYLRIEVEFDDEPKYLSGKRPKSDSINITMNLIELKGYNEDIDYLLEKEFKEIIEDESVLFLEEVQKKLDGKIDDEKFFELITNKKQDLYERFQDIAKRKYRDVELDFHKIKRLDSPINYSIPLFNTKVKMYRYSSSEKMWIASSTNNAEGIVSGFEYDLMPIVFAESSNILGNYGTSETKEIINMKEKYSLEYVLRNNGIFDYNEKVTSKLFKDVAASIISVEGSSVFEQAELIKKLDGLFVFNNNVLTREEVIYGYMQVYNMFSSEDINKMNIKNAYIVSGISGIDNYYRQSIMASVELELLDREDVINPKEQISVREFLSLGFKIIGNK